MIIDTTPVPTERGNREQESGERCQHRGGEENAGPADEPLPAQHAG
jgi:hypothetical protein